MNSRYPWWYDYASTDILDTIAFMKKEAYESRKNQD